MANVVRYTPGGDCCGRCSFGRDTFDGPDLSNNWEVRSGSPTIVAGSVRFASAGRIRFLTLPPNGDDSAVGVQVAIRGVSGSPAVGRIHLATTLDGSSSVWCEVRIDDGGCGYLQLGSGGTYLQDAVKLHAGGEHGTAFGIYVCFSPEVYPDVGILIGQEGARKQGNRQCSEVTDLDGQFGHNYSKATVDHQGLYVELECVSGSIEFDGFGATELYHPELAPDCPTCWPAPCEHFFDCFHRDELGCQWEVASGTWVTDPANHQLDCTSGGQIWAVKDLPDDTEDQFVWVEFSGASDLATEAGRKVSILFGYDGSTYYEARATRNAISGKWKMELLDSGGSVLASKEQSTATGAGVGLHVCLQGTTVVASVYHSHAIHAPPSPVLIGITHDIGTAPAGRRAGLAADTGVSFSRFRHYSSPVTDTPTGGIFDGAPFSFCLNCRPYVDPCGTCGEDNTPSTMIATFADVIDNPDATPCGSADPDCEGLNRSYACIRNAAHDTGGGCCAWTTQHGCNAPNACVPPNIAAAPIVCGGVHFVFYGIWITGTTIFAAGRIWSHSPNTAWGQTITWRGTIPPGVECNELEDVELAPVMTNQAGCWAITGYNSNTFAACLYPTLRVSAG